MRQYHPQWSRLASLIGVFAAIASPVLAQAEVPLTHGTVQTFRNRVELQLQGGLVRPVRDQDRLGFGDALRTNLASQADLQLSDGSFIRLGELTTFWVIPNTRNLWLAQGTGLISLAPDGGSTQIETPNAIAQTQGATVVIRHVQGPDADAPAALPGSEATLLSDTGRTAVMVLADPKRQGVQVSLRDARRVELTTGQMAIVDGDSLYLFAFNRDLFYETSALVQGLPASVTPPDTTTAAPPPTNDPAAASAAFTGEYWLDPRFLSPEADRTAESGWLFPANPQPAAPDVPLSETQTDSAAPEVPSPSEPTMADPDPLRETTHNDLTVEDELMPASPVPPATDEALPAPGQANTESLDLPAGVIEPPSEPSAPEPPTADPPPAIADPPPTEGTP